MWQGSQLSTKVLKKHSSGGEPTYLYFLCVMVEDQNQPQTHFLATLFDDLQG